MECEKPKIEATISSHTKSVYNVCFSPDQTILCSVGGGGNLILTNLQNYETQKVFTGHGGDINGSDFSSNGYFLVTASNDRTVRIWNVESENGNSKKLEGHSSYVMCSKYLKNDPTKVISGSFDKTIKIWSIERKKEISTLNDCKGYIWSIDILSDNQTIVSGDFSNEMRIFDFRSGKCVRVLDDHKNWVSSVQFHPNTFSLASGSHDKTIKIFDIRTFQLLQNYKDHPGWVKSVCFHPSGKFLLSGSSDTMLVFDLTKKKVLYNMEDHSSTVISVKFSPDGNYFASGCTDSKVFFWNFPLGRTIRREEDIDEEERVIYFVQKFVLLLVDSEDDGDCFERNILKIRIDDFSTIYCNKFFFL